MEHNRTQDKSPLQQVLSMLQDSRNKPPAQVGKLNNREGICYCALQPAQEFSPATICFEYGSIYLSPPALQMLVYVRSLIGKVYPIDASVDDVRESLFYISVEFTIGDCEL